MDDGRVERTMPKIMVLNEQTACRIAAGEVVERPVSVVKELVENSLDAGADLVNISITGGGIESITVVDNGCGISQEDTPLAFQRHATSKIKNAADLDRITTLGFRGEALPSIAAVADLTIKTRTPESSEGYYMHIRGGNMLDSGPAGCPVGTSIKVKDLFYNTPARRKYLKSKSTEGGLINDLVYKMALVRPRVRFVFIHNGREVLRSPGSGNIPDVLAAVYGLRAAKLMLPVNVVEAGIEIDGYVGKPELSRSTRQQITVAVNGRTVRSTTVNLALEDAYRGLLTVGRHPVAVLSIRLSPEKLDVNIHPAKMEIKMDREEELRSLVARAVRSVLRDTNLTPVISGVAPRTPKMAPTAEPFKLDLPVPQLVETLPRAEPAAAASGTSEEGRTNMDEHSSGLQPVSGADETSNERSAVAGEVGQVAEVPAGYRRTHFPDLRVAGQLMNAYIAAEGEGGVYIIDQHAAHERILFEKYIGMPGKAAPEVQYLLAPVNINLNNSEKELLREYKTSLKDLGFIFEDFGRNNYLLRGIPAHFSPGESERLVMDMVEEILEQGRVSKVAVEYAMAALLACKAAVKAGESLTMEAMQSLVDRLALADEPYTCPHGRPTIVSFTRRELDAMFKRT
ncbi:DNA mismatch repair endonuclease MutL [Desulfoscipio geothermicus]|uniref:DNA mismatch repair protein MutL n=1 Tax=Desulfoscipio geothermicus DSM 3669 TaxID=1121426 RepID=A0A1I6DKX9_9FIRM|nr:DNA mismatch repair endonuclease MutL [Desulfoscipio geothermicus]SFR06090.1 DNA mismatch repair protein MutL [Desulfoscipio geothermicus DSM 3669]